MNQSTHWEGIIPPVITPINDDYSIDEDGLYLLMEYRHGHNGRAGSYPPQPFLAPLSFIPTIKASRST